MPSKKTLIALLTAALLAGAPATALSQSSGDDQYTDPFAGQNGGGGNGGGGSGGGGGGSGSGAQGSSSGSSGAGNVASNGSSGSGSSAGTATGQLPNTGASPGLFAAIGATLSLGGVALRRLA